MPTFVSFSKFQYPAAICIEKEPETIRQIQHLRTDDIPTWPVSSHHVIQTSTLRLAHSILAYLHTCILAYLHTCILAYLHTCILAYLLDIDFISSTIYQQTYIAIFDSIAIIFFHSRMIALEPITTGMYPPLQAWQ